jgi:hypothetical protein
MPVEAQDENPTAEQGRMQGITVQLHPPDGP